MFFFLIDRGDCSLIGGEFNQIVCCERRHGHSRFQRRRTNVRKKTVEKRENCYKINRWGFFPSHQTLFRSSRVLHSCGSPSNTSSPAPAIVLALSSSARAASSTIPPFECERQQKKKPVSNTSSNVDQKGSFLKKIELF